jgi:hypothetical protein
MTDNIWKLFEQLPVAGLVLQQPPFTGIGCRSGLTACRILQACCGGTVSSRTAELE